MKSTAKAITIRRRQRTLVIEDALARAGVHPVLARLYASRGIRTPSEMTDGLGELIPPAEMLNADQAAVLLADAIAAGRRLLIVADYDCDGATACALGVRAQHEAWTEAAASARPHAGIVRATEVLRALIDPDDYEAARLQDPFGWRCLASVHGPLLDACHARGHRHHHFGPDQVEPPGDEPDEVAQHRFRSQVVRDHAVTHRPDNADRAGRAALHRARFVTDCHDGIVTIMSRNH